MLKRLLCSITLCAALPALQPAVAQDFPNRPIHLVIPYAPGGGSDILARPVSATMPDLIKAPVVVEHKPGAGGNIGTQYVARAQPDGYNLVVANNSQVINTFVYKQPGYAMDDLAPVTLLGTAPVLIVVHKDVPVSNLREFVDYARKNPGKLNMGSAGAGTPGHLANLLFNRQAGLRMQHIPYKGSGPATMALLQKEVDVFFATPAAVEPHVKSGNFKAIGVTSKTRFASFPTVPTVAESGVPELTQYAMDIWWGVLAPAKTPAAVLDRLHAGLTGAVNDPKNRERWLAQGMVPTAISRSEFQSLIRSELQKWEKVVRDNKISLD